jgi:hypothetical protein
MGTYTVCHNNFATNKQNYDVQTWEQGESAAFIIILIYVIHSSNIWEQHLQIKIVFMKRLRAD